MSTIAAILEPHADGSLHFPVLAEMPRGKVKVIATLIPIPGSMEQETGQRVKTLDSLRRMAARGGIKNIPDPALFRQLTEGKSLSAPVLVDEAQGAVRERDSFGSESGSL